MRKQTNTLSLSPKGFQSPKCSDSDFREVRGLGIGLGPDRIKTLIYQQRSKEMANHRRNGRNGSAKGKILPLKPKISGTERLKKDIG
jgi:hypothetical protein